NNKEDTDITTNVHSHKNEDFKRNIIVNNSVKNMRNAHDSDVSWLEYTRNNKNFNSKQKIQCVDVKEDNQNDTSNVNKRDEQPTKDLKEQKKPSSVALNTGFNCEVCKNDVDCDIVKTVPACAPDKVKPEFSLDKNKLRVYESVTDSNCAKNTERTDNQKAVDILESETNKRALYTDSFSNVLTANNSESRADLEVERKKKNFVFVGGLITLAGMLVFIVVLFCILRS
ncbi:hypothetical protein CDIK_3941, partial [Cucumispora dikerogammari]